MIGGDAVVAEDPHGLREVGILGRDRAALGGRDVLDRMEAERVDVGQATHRHAVEIAADGVAYLKVDRHALDEAALRGFAADV